MENKFFVVVSAPRSGSNYLCSLLSSHPQIFCHSEIFHNEAPGIHLKFLPSNTTLTNLQKRDENPVGFVKQLIAETEDFLPEITRVGCKILINEGQTSKGLEAVLAFKPHIIYLTRANKLAWFSSMTIAGISGIWVTEKKLEFQDKIAFSETDYQNQISTQNALEQKILDRLEKSGLPLLKIDYDAITEPFVHLQILDFLKAPIKNMAAKTHKQNPENLLDRFTNPAAVIAFANSINKSNWIAPTIDAEKIALNAALARLMQQIASHDTPGFYKARKACQGFMTKIGLGKTLKLVARGINLLKYQMRSR